jgi:hypothetical protein
MRRAELQIHEWRQSLYSSLCGKTIPPDEWIPPCCLGGREFLRKCDRNKAFNTFFCVEQWISSEKPSFGKSAPTKWILIVRPCRNRTYDPVIRITRSL